MTKNALEYTEGHGAVLEYLQDNVLNFITNYGGTRFDSLCLNPGLLELKNAHPNDLVNIAAECWALAKDKPPAEIVWAHISSTILDIAQDTPRDIGEHLPYPAHQIVQLQLLAINQANKDKIPMRERKDTPLYALSTEAMAMAFPQLADFSPEKALGVSNALLRDLPESSIHRTNIVKSRSKTIESIGTLTELFRYKNNNHNPQIESLFKAQAIKYFNMLSRDEQIDVAVKAVNDQGLRANLKGTIGLAKIKDTLKSARPEKLLSLIFDARIRESQIEGMSFKERHTAARNIKLDELIV